MSNKIKVFDYEALARATEIAASKGYVSIPKAALLLNMHHSTVRVYIRNGWIIAGTVGKRQVVFLDEIDRFKREGNYDPDKSLPQTTMEEGEQSLSSSYTAYDYD